MTRRTSLSSLLLLTNTCRAHRHRLAQHLGHYTPQRLKDGDLLRAGQLSSRPEGSNINLSVRECRGVRKETAKDRILPMSVEIEGPIFRHSPPPRSVRIHSRM